MKTLNKILFVALFLLTTSETYSANLLRQNLINAGSKENALTLYRLYSNSEKASVWSDKITQVLSLNIWNSSQINLLNNLHGEINSQIFDTTSQAFINFNGFMQTWKTQALSHFNIVQLRFIVTIVMDYNPNDVPEPGESNGTKCNCSTGSDWCGGTLIPGENCTSKLKCDEQDGCGTLWLHKCNGTCMGAQPMTTNGSIQW